MPKDKIKKKPEFVRGYERGFQHGEDSGINNGFEYAIVIVLLVLKDKFDFSDEQIDLFHECVKSYIETYKRGNFRFESMSKALGDDYNIHFKWNK